jgi:hypothetical protein
VATKPSDPAARVQPENFVGKKDEALSEFSHNVNPFFESLDEKVRNVFFFLLQGSWNMWPHVP